MGWNPNNLDVSTANFVPKMVPFDVVMLRPCSDPVLGGKSKSSRIVFVDSCLDGTIDRIKPGRNLDVANELKEHLSDGNEYPHACTESCVLCLHGTEGYGGLELRFPDQRHVG